MRWSRSWRGRSWPGRAGARTDATTATPGPLAGLIKQSKKESGLVFYANAPAANFKVVTDRFQYYYPWIKATAYDLDNNTIFSKYASEAAQGTRTADLLISSAPNLWVYAVRQKFLVDYDPLQLSTYPKFAKQYKGVFVMSPDPAIIDLQQAAAEGQGADLRRRRSRTTRVPTGS